MDHFKDIYEAASLNDENRLRKLLEIENDDLEDLLSRECMELQLNCVPLADRAKLVLERKLLNLRSSNQPSTSRLTTQEISDRLGFTIRLIHNLHTYEGNDELFIFNLVCIAKQICILKKILKSTYDRLPWEEIEFCVLTYIRSFKEQNEIAIFSKAILSKLNISSYLRMFVNHLEKLQEYVLTVKLQELVKFPNLKREEALDGIMANCPEFESLYNDHERLRDIHSLNIMLNSVQLVESVELEIDLIDYVDSEEKHSILVLLRALQVIAAHLKNTLDSPKLSQLTMSYLLTFFNRNTREILIELGDRLSNNQFPSNGEELLQSQDIEYLMGIKNDIEKIGKKIGHILLKYKLQLFRELAEKLYLTNDAQVFEEVVELMFKLDIPTLLEENICELNENNKLKDLIIQLRSKISPKSSYSEFTFGTILEEYPETLTIDYVKAASSLRVQCEKMYEPLQASCYYSLDTMKISKITLKNILDSCIPNMQTSKLNIIVERLITIFTVSPEQSELRNLFLQIIHIIKFENNSAIWAAMFGRKLSRIQEEELLVDKVSTNQKPETLAQLREIFTGTTYSEYKNDKNLQAVIETLLIDLIPMLKYPNLGSQSLFLEDNYPLIMGSDLQNHLINNDVIIEVLFDSTVSTFLFVERLLEVESRKHFDRITNIENTYSNSIDFLNKKQEMFSALKGNSFEAFLESLEKGADVRSRDIDMSTCLHFAVDKAEMLKDDERQTMLKEFFHNQGLRPELKNHKGQTPLHIAALKGNLEGVKFLLKNFDIDVDEVDSSKRTASHLAAFSGNELVLNELVYSRAHITKLDQRSRSPLVYAVMSGKKQMVEVFFKRNLFYKLYSFNRQTILHVAAANGQTALLDYLLSKKLKVDARNIIGETPLLEAAFHGHLKAVKTLIRHGADVNSRNNNDDCALHIACSINMEEMVEEVMKHKAEVDITGLNGYAPIHIAAQNGFTSILKILLANKANVNLATNSGSTPLHCAIASRHLNVVRILLKQNSIVVNIADKIGNTPLHLAAFNGDKKIFTLLMKHGANMNSNDLNGFNSLYVAAKFGHEAIVELLVANRESLQISTKNNKLLPLHLAVQSGNVNIINKLISKGSDVNATTANGSNCLHLAIKNERDVVDMLLLKRVEVEVKTVDCGFTPLHLAILVNNLKMVESLLNAGSHINAQDHLGNTPAHLAVERNSCEIFSYLVQKNANLTLENKMGESTFLTAVKHNRIEFVQICSSSGLIGDNLVFKLMYTAIEKGNTNIVDHLLERTAINPTIYHDSEENTVLHLAAMFGRSGLVKPLLNYGIDVDVKNKYSQTPLSIAATKGNEEVLEVLLNNKAQINMQDSDGFTPLHLASIQNNPKCVEILLAQGANSDIVDKNNKLAMEEAVTLGHLEVVKVFLKVSKNHLNRKGHEGFTLLHIAAQFRRATVVKLLISEEADMNIKDESGLLPIHIAAQAGFPDIVDIFIQNGVSLNVCGGDGESILHYAVSRGKMEVVKYLLKRGSNVNFKNAEGLTPLHTAVTRGYTEIVKLLLDNAAIYNVNYENTNATIQEILSSVDKLFSAIRVGDIAQIKECIKRGVPLNCVNIKKGSPLHFAVYKGNVKVVRLLLQNKVWTNTLYKNGWTPLHYAVKYSYYKIVLLLLRHGARYDIESDDGKKPVDFAENSQIIGVLDLIRFQFENIQKDNLNNFQRLKTIKDEDIRMAVLRAENEHGTILTASVKNNFSNLLSFQTIFMEESQEKEILDYMEASEVHLSLYQESKEMFGEDSLYTLWIKTIINTKLSNLKLYEQALTSREEVYEKLKEILGAEHKHTLLERRSIALIFSSQGNNEKSLKILKEIYEMQKKYWPLDIEESLKTLTLMAIVLRNMKKAKRSRNILNAILKIHKKNFNILNKLDIKFHLAQAYSQQGQHNEALKHFQAVYEGRKLRLGPDHPETYNILEELIIILANQKRYAEATKECGRLLKFQEKYLGQHHLRTILTQSIMADLLLKQSNYYSAHKISKAMKGSNVAEATDLGTKLLDFIAGFYANIGINSNSLISTMIEAIQSGDIDTVEKFLETGFEVDEKDVEGRNLLHYAVDRNHLELVELFLAMDADVTGKTNKGNTVLHIACNKGYHDIVEQILDNVKVIESSYLINSSTNLGKMTALHLAAKQGSPKIVRMLLMRGAKYNCLNNDRKTPLDLAQDEDVKSILRLTEDMFIALHMRDFSVVTKLYQLEKEDFLCVTSATDIQNYVLVDILVLMDERKIGRNLLATWRTIYHEYTSLESS